MPGGRNSEKRKGTYVQKALPGEKSEYLASTKLLLLLAPVCLSTETLSLSTLSSLAPLSRALA